MMQSNGLLKIIFGSALVALALAMLSCSSEEPGEDDAEVQTNEFDQSWYELDDAVKKASENDDWVQVFVHVNWCHTCRQMQEETYTDAGVEDNLDTWHYPVSLNAESRDSVTFKGNEYTEEELAREWGVDSYPTILFIDSEGELFARENGYIDAQTYRQMLEFIGTNAFEEQSFDAFTGG